MALHDCKWIKKNTWFWANKKISWICRLCTLWCSHNSPCVDNFCKNAYFSFSSKSDEVKLNVSSNSRSCDMSGFGGNVSSSHLYPRNLWCVMAKYATQGNVQIPLPRSKAQRFSQSKTNHKFSRFLFSLHITADQIEIAIAAVLLVELLHLVTIVGAPIAGQFRTGFRSNDSGTSHLIQGGRRMQDSQVWPTMAAYRTPVLHIEFYKDPAHVMEVDVPHNAKAMYRASGKCIASQRSSAANLCLVQRDAAENFEAPWSLSFMLSGWKYQQAGRSSLLQPRALLFLFHVFCLSWEEKSSPEPREQLTQSFILWRRGFTSKV